MALAQQWLGFLWVSSCKWDIPTSSPECRRIPINTTTEKHQTRREMCILKRNNTWIWTMYKFIKLILSFYVVHTLLKAPGTRHMTKHWPCITTFSTFSSHTGLKIKYADVIFWMRELDSERLSGILKAALNIIETECVCHSCLFILHLQGACSYIPSSLFFFFLTCLSFSYI